MSVIGDSPPTGDATGWIPSADLFDQVELVSTLKRWAATESSSYDWEGVNAMMTIAEGELTSLGAAIERIPGLVGYGDTIRARFGRESDRGGVLVLAHLDTVHRTGAIATHMPIRRDGDRLYGPGVFDMKGGALLAIRAIGALQAAGRRLRRPVTLICTPDEELGSPHSRRLIERQAAGHACVLIPEPAQEGGDLITGRWGFQRFTVHATGRPAHAGARLVRGASAISEIARQISQIDSLTDLERDTLVSVGVIQGGTFVNVVPVRCSAQVLVVTRHEDEAERTRRAMLDRRSSNPDIRLEVEPGPIRPLWNPTPAGLEVFELAHGFARRLGFDPNHATVGGGSDGNFTGALGVPTLDGLGPCGDGFHTPDEHVLVSSLVPRARVFCALLNALAGDLNSVVAPARLTLTRSKSPLPPEVDRRTAP